VKSLGGALKSKILQEDATTSLLVPLFGTNMHRKREIQNTR
jgi:hypothetical protein